MKAAAHPEVTLDHPMPTVLLTGFEPFDQLPLNASWLAVSAVDPQRLPGVDLARACLPVVFDEALARLRAEVRAHQPRVVICVGQAAGRRAISLERVAINVDDARIPDNNGHQPVDRPIAPDGPAAYWSSLPVRRILTALEELRLPGEISDSAGTFVCNHVFYGLMHDLRRTPGVRAGFIHVPLLPEQAVGPLARAPSLPLEVQALALEVAVATALSDPTS
jgi:pyroglutamyl-peptidase